MKINRDELQQLHENEEHGKILAAIEKLPRGEWDFELSSLYARALNNLDRYQEALEILLSLEEQGREDALWNFRTGYSYYYLDDPRKALGYFEKAVELGDTEENTLLLLNACKEEIEAEENGEPADRAFTLEMYSEKEMEAVEAHIAKYFGEYKHVFHEVVSPDIHVDIAVIDPTSERNYYVLCTMGMGAHRMTLPEELDNELERAEILVCLPPDWKFESIEDEDENEKWYWPLRWLKILARLPIEEDTWLGWGHTVPNGEPFAGNTGFTTVLLLTPGGFDNEAAQCELPSGKTINFYQMIPLYEEEANYKIQNNTDRLLTLLDDSALEYVKLDRKCVVPTGHDHQQ